MNNQNIDVSLLSCARLPAAEGEFWLWLFKASNDDKEHLALTMGDLKYQHDVLVRLHSECFTGDVLGSLRCDCGEQLHMAMARIAAAGRGAVIYLRQEGRGIGLADKLRAYNLQDEGYDTVDANLLLGHQADERDYTIAARIIEYLAIHSVHLLTNNPEKIEALQALGITVSGREALTPTIHKDNAHYLETKVRRMGHLFEMQPQPKTNHRRHKS